jgi:hypothetical protein
LVAQTDLANILLALEYTTADRLATIQKIDSVPIDEITDALGSSVEMVRQARLFQAVLLGKQPVPEEGFVFGDLGQGVRRFLAIQSDELPGYDIICVCRAPTIAEGVDNTAPTEDFELFSPGMSASELVLRVREGHKRGYTNISIFPVDPPEPDANAAVSATFNGIIQVAHVVTVPRDGDRLIEAILLDLKAEGKPT